MQHAHEHTHKHTLRGKWGHNVSNFSVNLAHCVRNNRHSCFGFAVCAWVPAFGCLKCWVFRSSGQRVPPRLTCWQRAGGPGYKYCRRRSRGGCKPERKRGTKRGVRWGHGRMQVLYIYNIYTFTQAFGVLCCCLIWAEIWLLSLCGYYDSPQFVAVLFYYDT